MLIRGSAILRNQTAGDGGDSPAAGSFTEAQIAELAKALSPTINSAITGHLKRQPTAADEISKLDWDSILLPVVTKFIDGEDAKDPANPPDPDAPAEPKPGKQPKREPTVDPEVKTQLNRYETAFKGQAERSMATLTTEQQAAVRKIAPDSDPVAQLSAIDALTPTWAGAKPAAPAATAAPQAPPTPPTGTAPPPDAPPSGTASPTDHAAKYAELEKRNPILAARYAIEHATEIYKP